MKEHGFQCFGDALRDARKSPLLTMILQGVVATESLASLYQMIAIYEPLVAILAGLRGQDSPHEGWLPLRKLSWHRSEHFRKILVSATFSQTLLVSETSDPALSVAGGFGVPLLPLLQLGTPTLKSSLSQV